MSMYAVVFVRRSGADGTGHVGWAFDCSDGTFNTGSVENPRHTLRTSPEQMGFWMIRTGDPIAPMRDRVYNECKVIAVEQGNPEYAWQVVAWVSRQPYEVFSRNCMDVTYDVLRGFGVPNLPVPAHHWEPNHWFDHIQGQHYQLDTDEVMLESDGRGPAPMEFELPDLDSLLTSSPEGVKPAVPVWRTMNTPEWLELQTAMAAAPSMPAVDSHRNRFAHQGIIARIRHLFGSAQAHG